MTNIANIANIVPVEDNSSSTPGLEKTFAILKPDAIERNLVDTIITRIELAGFNITKSEVKRADHKTILEHYVHIANKPFFTKIVEYMTRGDVFLLELERVDAINKLREIVGKTNPLEADPGTIRGDLGVPPIRDHMENLIHCSDSQEAYEFEYKLWFEPEEEE